MQVIVVVVFVGYSRRPALEMKQSSQVRAAFSTIHRNEPFGMKIPHYIDDNDA